MPTTVMWVQGVYRGREVVERNIHQSEAIDHLIDIIKRDGRWHDPE